MRRGGRARRAMLGAVATGALLGAAQGFNLGWKSLLASATAQSDGEAGGYTGRAVSASSWGNRLAVGEAKADESKSQVSAEMSPVHRRRLAARLLSQVPATIDFEPNGATPDNTYDGTYKVVTASGLEIEIDSTSVAGVYTIAPIKSTSDGSPAIAVDALGGSDLSACTSDITLNLNNDKITCAELGTEISAAGIVVTKGDEVTTIAKAGSTDLATDGGDTIELEGNGSVYVNGFDADGFGADGFNADGFNAAGYNAAGFDVNGFDADGFDVDGFDAAGLDENGYDADGFGADGFNADGFNAAGYNAAGFDVNG